jgi:hypothetical protein
MCAVSPAARGRSSWNGTSTGLWRYFQKFEARQRSLPVRAAVWGAIWAHALMLVPRLLRRSL